jgi:hypothetical protein
LAPPSGRAQVIDPELWGVDNTVSALARSGKTLFVGGAFRRVGPCTGGAVAMPKYCADPRKPFPKVTGYVYSIAADAHGGWFLSGNFTAVGGVPRYCLAHVLSDGRVAPWNPNPNYVPYGTGGLLVSGSTVYVSGGFATISGKPRLYIAALDATTGEALAWDAHADGIATPLAIHGNTVYVGGLYGHIGGQPRNNIAALDATSGAATAWNPDADDGVWSVAVRGKHIYVGGSFSHIGGEHRSLIAEVDAEIGMATEWNPGAEGPSPNLAVIALLLHGDKLYVGGSFTSIGGRTRLGLAAFDAKNGIVTPWDPNARAAYGSPNISILRADGNSIYVGGYFQSIGEKPRNYVAELDARTAAATDWNPDPSNVVYGMALAESTVCIGGTFKSMGMVPRHNLAAFDVATGRVTDWNPNPDGLIVYALATNGGTLYAGGDFTQIGGQSRSDLAALDMQTGAATDWNPGSDQAVRTLLVNGSTVYVGGGFQRIGGQPRRYLAAVDAATGDATGWNPDPTGGVLALCLRANTVYAGGLFSQIGGEPRLGLAALDRTSGALLPWHADTDGAVEGLTLIGNTLYACGIFEQIESKPRRNLAAIDAESGELKPWNPSPDGPREDAFYASVYTLAARGNTLIVGGDFTVIGGQHRASLAAVDGVTGAVLDWDPNPDQSVRALEASGDRVFAGGFFQAAEQTPRLALIGADPPGESIAVGQPSILDVPFPHRPIVVMAPITPNPVRSSAVLRYALATATAVSLSVYDLQGRRVEGLLDHEVRAAGEHQLSVRMEDLPTGCYVYRLEAAGHIRTQKVVVLR